MPTVVTRNGDVFEAHCDAVEVTSLHRPDERWKFTDAHGHLHRWHVPWPNCEACDAGYRLNADGIHYDDAGGGLTWGVCRKLTPIPATNYNPSKRYEVPSLIWVKDGEEYWDGDDEPHDVGHLECRQCGEHVQPGYTADDTRQFMPGLRHYTINGEAVTQAEFERRVKELQ